MSITWMFLHFLFTVVMFQSKLSSLLSIYNCFFFFIICFVHCLLLISHYAWFDHFSDFYFNHQWSIDVLYLFWGFSPYFSLGMLIFIFSIEDVFILFVTSSLKQFIINLFDFKCINNWGSGASCLVHSNEENWFPVERVRINYRLRRTQKSNTHWWSNS